MNCSQCNAQNQPDSRFCFRCGFNLTAGRKSSISNPLAILIGGWRCADYALLLAASAIFLIKQSKFKRQFDATKFGE